MFESITKIFKKDTGLTAHNKILQGLDVWNKWREENPEINPQKSGKTGFPTIVGVEKDKLFVVVVREKSQYTLLRKEK